MTFPCCEMKKFSQIFYEHNGLSLCTCGLDTSCNTSRNDEHWIRVIFFTIWGSTSSWVRDICILTIIHDLIPFYVFLHISWRCAQVCRFLHIDTFAIHFAATILVSLSFSVIWHLYGCSKFLNIKDAYFKSITMPYFLGAGYKFYRWLYSLTTHIFYLHMTVLHFIFSAVLRFFICLRQFQKSVEQQKVKQKKSLSYSWNILPYRISVT